MQWSINLALFIHTNRPCAAFEGAGLRTESRALCCWLIISTQTLHGLDQSLWIKRICIVTQMPLLAIVFCCAANQQRNHASHRGTVASTQQK